MGVLSLETILQALEREREAQWDRCSKAVELKLHWRAQALKHDLHVLPGETILELGGGSGRLAEQLRRLLRGENPITSVVFSKEFLVKAQARGILGVTFLYSTNLRSDFGPAQFDYVVGSGMLWHRRLPDCLALIHRVLKPGGEIRFFEPNFRFPARVFHKLQSQGGTAQTLSFSVDRVMQECSHQDFTHISLTPYDIVSCRLGPRVMQYLQSKAVLLEHMPAVRLACASMFLAARKPGYRIRQSNLATRVELRRAISVVLPAHNEASNLPRLVDALISLYGDYIHEIIVVNDNSTDETAEVTRTIANADARVRLLNRAGPNGVGRALKDGYRAVTGRYILSMDCDFADVLPDIRGLFDAVADGHDGVIGSRFSHESILNNYPFWKLFFNRLCHAVIKLFLLHRVRDVTNNLKLYRADILKALDIESPHFSANLETGLKPLLAGRDIVEVPISWSNRTFAMETSSFDIALVGGDYARVLLRCWRKPHSERHGLVQLLLRRLRHRSVGALKSWT